MPVQQDLLLGPPVNGEPWLRRAGSNVESWFSTIQTEVGVATMALFLGGYSSNAQLHRLRIRIRWGQSGWGIVGCLGSVVDVADRSR